MTFSNLDNGKGYSRFIAIAIVLFIFHLMLSWNYGKLIPWGGDEWYSYHDFTISGLPFSIQVWLLKHLLPSLTYENYHIYRASNFLWTALSFLLLTSIALRIERWRALSMYMMSFMIISPFVIGTEQFFRYYNLYLLSSLCWFWAILIGDNHYRKYRVAYWAGWIMSISIHFLLFYGIALYILFRELNLLPKKWKKLVLGAVLIGGILFIFSGVGLLKSVFELAGNGNYKLPETGNVTRGFSLALIYKPFFAIFVFLMGEKIVPTENIAVLSIFVLSSFSLLLGFLKQVQNKEMFIVLLFAFLIPFLGLYWFVEPLTLPGMTQFEPKHAMFVFPWIVFLWYQTTSIKQPFLKIFGFFPFIGAGLGLFFSLNMEHIKWERAIETIIESHSKVLHDPRIANDLYFYGKGRLDSSNMINIYDTAQAYKVLSASDKVCIASMDYKSYQLLDMRQMWNSASSSEGRYTRINSIYRKIQQANYEVESSYVQHPVFIYCFDKEAAKKAKPGSTQPIPWFYPMYYKDLSWPRTISGQKKGGIYPLEEGEFLQINSRQLFHFIQIKGDIKTTQPILNIHFNNGDVTELILAEMDHDTYSTYYSQALEGAFEVDSWNKRPLVSSSHQYPGSKWSSEGKIYLWESNEIIEKIEVLSDDIVFNYVL